MSTKYPHKIEELPNKQFLAILIESSVMIPGDERSRTNPGHGYPEHSVDQWEMETFTDEDAFHARIIELRKDRWRKFKPVRIQPLTIKETITLVTE